MQALEGLVWFKVKAKVNVRFWAKVRARIEADIHFSLYLKPNQTFKRLHDLQTNLFVITYT
jgi:hypothetical protein